MEKLDAKVYKYLTGNGVKCSNLGFEFLMAAIRIGMESPDKLRKIVELYGEIAEVHNVPPGTVEKAIRYSLLGRDERNKEFIIKAINEIKYFSLSGELSA